MAEETKVPWYKRKTAKAALAAMVAAVFGWWLGELALFGMIEIIVASIAAIFMRQGIAKIGT